MLYSYAILCYDKLYVYIFYIRLIYLLKTVRVDGLIQIFLLEENIVVRMVDHTNVQHFKTNIFYIYYNIILL